ncbi:DNA repair protein RecN [Candidatus Borreliella tachyglossi]|uniref:DNA repair protein RecN n=1 Tax=Candidatus Borreliella tachyglossi TaxID=1964448 RepID=A0A2S1LWN8_9SPIR|nr:DNA repair protein RecN [Candidatus Borreliella tachyglossi]AWG42696.1 DNA repair protein RecN [Candidatus Borreliella tachyglossi]
MLIELFIKNFVLIKEISIKLNKGLIALTGESGSGKSLLLSSIYYLFGGKLKDNIIMDGERECILLAKFRANSDARDYLFSKGILVEDSIIIKRVITFKSLDTFLSNYYINNEPISSIILKPVFDMLVEVHSQNQQYLILKNPSNNLKILDNYANLNAQLKEYKLAYEAYMEFSSDYDDFILKEKSQKENIEECERILNEIDSLDPKMGEEEILKGRLDELRNHESLCRALLSLKNTLSVSESTSALVEIKKIICDAEYLSSISNDYLELENRLKSSYYELEDIGQVYSKYLFSKTYDEMEIEAVESRLYELSRLKKKYGPNLEDVIGLRRRCDIIIHSALNFETERIDREKKLSSLLEKLKRLSSDISGVRRDAGLVFASGVTGILHKLNMSNAEFFVSVSDGEMSCTGVDDVEFLISSNLGLKAQPIYRIASGGELSRIMLAIKSVQNVDEDKLIIFDEIDSGIGGEAGVSLGKYLKGLSDNVQIFVVTHLANIASLADYHILVKKQYMQSKTYVQTSLLLDNDRVLEIARMLSGNVNNVSIKHAEELLRNDN